MKPKTKPIHLGAQKPSFLPQAIHDLYRQHPQTYLFIDPLPDKKFPGLNRHHQTAAALIKKNFSASANGSIVSIMGTMGSGKTAMLILLTQILKIPFQAFYHQADKNRNGHKNIIKSWGNKQALPARQYENLKDLIKAITKAPSKSLILIDEWQFCSCTKVAIKEMNKLTFMAKKLKLRLVVSGLDFSFKRQIWPNTKPLLKISDLAMVLTSRCSQPKCQEPAVFPQLNINGQPASIADKLVNVGNVNMQYFPKCGRHHQLKEDNIKNYLI